MAPMVYNWGMNKSDCFTNLIPPVGCKEVPVSWYTITKIGVDDRITPPVEGSYHNTMVLYEDTGNVYMFDTAGIPTLIKDRGSVDDHFDLKSKNPVQNKVVTAAVNELTSQIQSEIEAREEAVANVDAKAVKNAQDITKNKQDIAANAEAISAETTERQNAVTAVDNKAEKNASDIMALQEVVTENSAEIVTNSEDIAALQANKQDNLTSAQLDAVDSGITSARVEKYDGYEAKITKNTEDLAQLREDFEDSAEGLTEYTATLNERINIVEESTNKDVVTSVTVGANESTDVIKLDNALVNIKTGATGSSESPFPVASETSAGIMNSATFKAVQENSAKIDLIENATIALNDLDEDITQDELTQAWEEVEHTETLVNGAKIYDVANQRIWTYYKNLESWESISTAGGGEAPSVNRFTNTTAGIIKGSTTDGQVFAEANGTGSVNGWDSVKSDVSNNASAIESINETLGSLDTNVSNKLDKVTSESDRVRFYGVTKTGDQAMYEMAEVNLPYTIPRRNADGLFGVGTPVGDDQVANKGYVDTAAKAVVNSTRLVYVGNLGSNVRYYKVAHISQMPEQGSSSCAILVYGIIGGYDPSSTAFLEGYITNRNTAGAGLKFINYGDSYTTNTGVNRGTFYACESDGGGLDVYVRATKYARGNIVFYSSHTGQVTIYADTPYITTTPTGTEVPITEVMETPTAVDNALAEKVDKVTTGDTARVYAVNANNEQTMYTISSNLTNDAIVKRTSTGTARVADPTADNEAATKKYVDDKTIDTNHIVDSAVTRAKIKDGDALKYKGYLTYSDVSKYDDLVDYTDTGYYYLGASINPITGSGNVYGELLVFGNTGTRTTDQILLGAGGSGYIYHRHASGTPKVWNAWKRMATVTDLNDKLDKVTSTSDMSQAYIKGPDGTQMMLNIDNLTAEAYTIVQRDSSGKVVVTTPVSDNQAANKEYVDSLVTVTNTDPGEGGALEAGHLIAVVEW